MWVGGSANSGQNWHEVTKDPEILNTVQGHKLGLFENPKPTNTPTCPKNKAAMREKIEEMLKNQWDWFVKIDLQTAYDCVLITQNDRKFLQFKFQLFSSWP